MQGNILVKTPLTIDGNMPLMVDGRQVYSESILTEAARKSLEKRNTQLPTPLKVIIEEYNGPVGVKAENEVPIVIPQPAPVSQVVQSAPVVVPPLQPLSEPPQMAEPVVKTKKTANAKA